MLTALLRGEGGGVVQPRVSGAQMLTSVFSKLTSAGRFRVVRVPSPSRPLPLKPQQNGTPTASSAQVWVSPTAIDTALAMPLTSKGSLVIGKEVPMPSWPLPLAPQQRT